MSAITAQVIETAAGLEELEPEWQRLMERSPGATPFQSPEWLVPWWSCFGPGGLFTIAFRSRGDLVGLAPLFFRDRSVLLIGTGITDHLGLLYEPEFQDAVVSGVREPLLDRRADWDICDFQELPSASPLLKAGIERGEVMEQSVCPTLALSDFQPEGKAKKLRTSRRNLEKHGELRFETAHAEETDEYLQALFLLHSRRWADQGGRGVLSEPGIRRFHHLVAHGFARRSYLRFHGLRVGGSLIAVLYWFQHRGHAYSYLTGFDPAYARFGPGSLIHHHALLNAMEAGDAECDFLRGPEEYKYSWGARDRKNYRLLTARALSGE